MHLKETVSYSQQSLWGGALRDDTKNGCVADYTADGDLLFTFSRIINILDLRRSLSSYLKFGSRHEDLPRFCY